MNRANNALQKAEADLSTVKATLKNNRDDLKSTHLPIFFLPTCLRFMEEFEKQLRTAIEESPLAVPDLTLAEAIRQATEEVNHGKT